jgi:hypothetical protein
VRRTKRWTGATGSDFRIKRDPAKLLCSAVARSTLTFDAYSGGYMRALAAFLFSMLFSPILLAQTSQQPKPQSTSSPAITQQVLSVELPKGGSYRPRLTLQDALKIAERYIVKEKINISHYYLFEAKYILYGDKDNKDPSWYFWWTNEDGALGNYVQLVVSIKTGSVQWLTSM